MVEVYEYLNARELLNQGQVKTPDSLKFLCEASSFHLTKTTEEVSSGCR